MRRFIAESIALTLLFLVSCSAGGDRERLDRWSNVQKLEAAYREAGPETRTEAKQRWADAVRAFLDHWPDDPDAVRTWDQLQLDYAEQLEANGRFREARAHYRSLAERLPDDDRVSEGLARVERRLSLNRGDFEAIRKGMSREEVSRWLGVPRPGWDRRGTRDGNAPVESWYYKGADGVIRGVHFREGLVFEVDLD